MDKETLEMIANQNPILVTMAATIGQRGASLCVFCKRGGAFSMYDGFRDWEHHDKCPWLVASRELNRLLTQTTNRVLVRAQEMGTRKLGAGEALYYRLHADTQLNYRQLLIECNERWPGKWVVQSIPTMDRAMDDAHIYHLLVFEETPKGFDLNRWVHEVRL